jgi:hypothetical protein
VRREVERGNRQFDAPVSIRAESPGLSDNNATVPTREKVSIYNSRALFNSLTLAIHASSLRAKLRIEIEKKDRGRVKSEANRAPPTSQFRLNA